MIKSDIPRIALRLFTLLLLSLSLWMLSISIAGTRRSDQLIPIKITKQLDPINGVIPAEIQCETALINASNELEFTCKLRNNSAKKITAAAVIYSIVIEKDGVEMKDEHSSVFANLIGPQFEGIDKATAPGEERSIGPAGPISYNQALIRGVEVGIDFVEFEDNLMFGQGGKGAQVVKEIREGAVKYRDWIRRKYAANRKSGNAITTLLESVELLPSEMGLLNRNQEFGAKAYRRKLKKKLDAGDYTEVDRLLSQ